MIRRLRSWWAPALAATTLAVAPGTAGAQDVVWDVGNALGLGTGCDSEAGDVMFITFGNDFAVIFRGLDIRLPANGPDPALSQLRSCNIRIPATIKSGRMISQLSYGLGYGVSKSANTSAKITAAAQFFGLPAASFDVSIPQGLERSREVVHHVTPFLVTSACTASAHGLFKIDMAVGGNRASTSETLLVGVSRLHDITLSTSPCS
jgi:hypothetical protein